MNQFFILLDIFFKYKDPNVSSVVTILYFSRYVSEVLTYPDSSSHVTLKLKFARRAGWPLSLDS